MSAIISSTGTLTVRATVKNGATETTDFVMNFYVDVTDPQPFISVEKIQHKNIFLDKNTSTELNCIVTPENATKAKDVIYKPYTFTDKSLATISGNVVTAGNTNGKFTIEAVVEKAQQSSTGTYWNVDTKFDVYICDGTIDGTFGNDPGTYITIPSGTMKGGMGQNWGCKYPAGVEFEIRYGVYLNKDYHYTGAKLYLNGKVVSTNPSATEEKVYKCKFEKGSIDHLTFIVFNINY